MLAAHRIKARVVGQGATVGGLRRILAGTQCATVYVSPKREAAAVVVAATGLLTSRSPGADPGTDVTHPTDGRPVAAVLVPGQVITAANVAAVVSDGYVSGDQLCAGGLAASCRAAGIG